MGSAPPQMYDETPEILVAFDLLVPGSRVLLRTFCRAWGNAASVECLGHGRAVLVVQPGGALGLAR